jgi:predicted CopG family antitoxin
MPTRSLTVKEEAYQALKAMKKENESFTDVILRLTSKKSNARELLEKMDRLHSPKLADRIEETSKEFRKNFKLRKIEF